MSPIDYKSAGVDISAGNEAVERIKPWVQKTFTPAVCTDLGAFGALFDLKALLQDYDYPILVQSIDGVGTKTHVAHKMQRFDTIGIDLVSAACNDILVMGARPLTMLDYIASASLSPTIVEQIVKGMSLSCAENGIALIGGETAEMPGTYHPGEHDLVGTVTGLVEKDDIIDGRHIQAGDILFGIQSSGLHTNGYSLARKLFFDTAGWEVSHYSEELQATIGDVLLRPHLNYTRPILHCLEQNIPIKGMAHITGGGFIENIPRILPEHCAAEIQRGAWEIPREFSLMQALGQLNEQEMFRTFNMGIGMVIIADEQQASHLHHSFAQFPGFACQAIGEVVSDSHKTVRLVG